MGEGEGGREGEKNNACNNARVKSWMVYYTTCDHVLDLARIEVRNNENVAGVQTMGVDVYRLPSSILTAKKYERDRQRDEHYYHPIWPTHLARTKGHSSAAATAAAAAATATATAQQQRHAFMHGQI